MSRRGRAGVQPKALFALWAAMRGQRRPGAPSASQSLRILPRLVAATASGEYRGTSTRQLALMAAAAAYVAVPIDVLPELVLPGLGLVDDGLVLAWLAGALLTETDAFLAWEREGRPAHGRPSAAPAPAPPPQGPSQGSSQGPSQGPRRGPGDPDVIVGEVIR